MYGFYFSTRTETKIPKINTFFYPRQKRDKKKLSRGRLEIERGRVFGEVSVFFPRFFTVICDRERERKKTPKRILDTTSERCSFFIFDKLNFVQNRFRNFDVLRNKYIKLQSKTTLSQTIRGNDVTRRRVTETHAYSLASLPTLLKY